MKRYVSLKGDLIKGIENALLNGLDYPLEVKFEDVDNIDNYPFIDKFEGEVCVDSLEELSMNVDTLTEEVASKIEELQASKVFIVELDVLTDDIDCKYKFRFKIGVLSPPKFGEVISDYEGRTFIWNGSVV